MADVEQPPTDDWILRIPDQDVPDIVVAPAEGIVPLGFDRGIFYYLSRSAKQVFALTPQQHTRPFFIAMASVPHHWSRTQFAGDKGKIDWDAAADFHMRACRDVGVYDPERIRGRGAWFDDGHAVLHLGDRLIVDGIEGPLMLAGSRCVYEAALPLLGDLPEPLSTVQAHALVKICAKLQWEKPIDGTLLAGFLAIAPICGGLAWRPSIWLTGPTASGKTWVYENIIAACLRGFALFVQSKTSEAGIRQTLGSDARPVAFDEAEAEDQAAEQRMQAVLDLIRQSSSETGGDILKGTQTHVARRFRVRSCFALVSINVSIKHAADVSRITVMPLRAHGSDSVAFTALREASLTTLTPAFAAALIARSAQLLPVIRANAEIFAEAVALKLSSRRAGDQIGSLLAGAYSLHSDTTITPAQAKEFVERQQWDAVADPSESDERRLLAAITQSRTRIAFGNGGTAEATVGRLIVAAAGHDERIPADIAAAELRQIGIRYADRDGLPGVFISTNHPAIAAMLLGTPWHSSWSRTLLRLPGAEASQKTMRFGLGAVSKATWLPYPTIDPDDEEG